MLLGIDISHYQYPVNFDLVKQSGVKYIIVKATEGTSFIDTAFDTFWYNIKRINLPRGAYHYYRPTMNKLAQVKLFYSKAFDTGSPPIIDVELYKNYTDDVNYYLTTPKDKIRSDLKELLDFTESYFKIKPIIYTGYYFWKDNYSPCEWAKNYSLWIAHYGVATPLVPADWSSNYIMHQYTSSGIIPGIAGYTDLNKTTLSEDDLYKLFRFTTASNNVLYTKPYNHVFIVTKALNIREYPSTLAKIVGYVNNGETYTELEEKVNSDSKWSRIGKNQWIAKEYAGYMYANYKYT